MEETYYSQRAARHMREGLLPVPRDLPVHGSYLKGATKADIIAGLSGLRSLLSRAYDDMATDPAAYGLPTFAMAEYGLRTAEARSAKAVYRLPNLLYNLGQASELVDGGLVVDKARFRGMDAVKKVPGAPNILGRLAGLGLECRGFGGKGLAEGATSFVVSYPENPRVLIALKAFTATIAPDEHKNRSEISGSWYCLSHKLLARSTPDEPELDLDDFAYVIGEENAAFLRPFNERMLAEGYKARLDPDCGNYRGHWKLNYDFGGKYTCHYFRYEHNVFCLRLKLNSVGAYTNHVEAASDSVRQGFENYYRCGHCRGVCGMRVVFTLGGEKREGCICDAFRFDNPRIEDIDAYLELLALEREAASRGKGKGRVRE